MLCFRGAVSSPRRMNTSPPRLSSNVTSLLVGWSAENLFCDLSCSDLYHPFRKIMLSQGPSCDVRSGKNMLIIFVECFSSSSLLNEMSGANVLGVVLACRCVRRDCR